MSAGDAMPRQLRLCRQRTDETGHMNGCLNEHSLNPGYVSQAAMATSAIVGDFWNVFTDNLHPIRQPNLQRQFGLRGDYRDAYQLQTGSW